MNPFTEAKPFDPVTNNPWAPRKPGNTMRIEGSTALDNHTPVLSAEIRDGEIVTRSSGPLRSSVHEAADAANRQANVPYEYAIDPRTKSRLMPHQVTEDSIVCIHGTTLTVRDARAIGWMPPTGKSTSPFNEASPSDDQETTEDAEQETSEPEAEAFADESADEAFTKIIAATAPQAQLAAVTEIISDGEVSEKTLNALASQMGLHPTELQATFAPVLAAYEAQGRATVEKTVPGVDSSAVFDWAAEHAPEMLKKVMHIHATERRTYGYEALAQAWLEQLADTDADSCLASNIGDGWSSRLDDKGKVVVTSPQGREMSWRAAMETRRRV